MIPENELGVIVLFAQQAAAAGFEIVNIQATFPDAVVRRAGVDYRVEFEYKASNFQEHRHDPRECDLIVCWQNDLPSYVLPILVLSVAGWPTADLTLPAAADREVAYWKQRAILAENRLKFHTPALVAAGRITSRRRRGELDATAQAMIEREFPVAVGKQMAGLFVTARDIYGGVPQVVIERPDVPVALIVASLDETRELIKVLTQAVKVLDDHSAEGEAR